MAVSPCSTVSHLLCWRGNPKSGNLCEIWESTLVEMIPYSATHKWLVNAVRSFSHLPYASKEGYQNTQTAMAVSQHSTVLHLLYVCMYVLGNSPVLLTRKRFPPQMPPFWGPPPIMGVSLLVGTWRVIKPQRPNVTSGEVSGGTLTVMPNLLYGSVSPGEHPRRRVSESSCPG